MCASPDPSTSWLDTVSKATQRVLRSAAVCQHPQMRDCGSRDIDALESATIVLLLLGFADQRPALSIPSFIACLDSSVYALGQHVFLVGNAFPCSAYELVTDGPRCRSAFAGCPNDEWECATR
jgi:hypothetical protein